MNDFINTYEEKLPEGEISTKTLEQVIDARIAAILQINFAKECYMSVMCHAYTEQDEAFRLEVLAAIDQSNQTMRQLIIALQHQKAIEETLEVDELMEFIDFAWRGARPQSSTSKIHSASQCF